MTENGERRALFGLNLDEGGWTVATHSSTNPLYSTPPYICWVYSLALICELTVGLLLALEINGPAVITISRCSYRLLFAKEITALFTTSLSTQTTLMKSSSLSVPAFPTAATFHA